MFPLAGSGPRSRPHEYRVCSPFGHGGRVSSVVTLQGSVRRSGRVLHRLVSEQASPMVLALPWACGGDCFPQGHLTGIELSVKSSQPVAEPRPGPCSLVRASWSHLSSGACFHRLPPVAGPAVPSGASICANREPGQGGRRVCRLPVVYVLGILSAMVKPLFPGPTVPCDYPATRQPGLLAANNRN